MIYKKLNPAGTKWERCEADQTKRQIRLYDKNPNGQMINTAIGLY